MNLPTIVIDERVEASHRTAILNHIADMSERGLPPILSLEHLSAILGLRTEVVFGMTNAQHAFYRRFKIRKANGGRREISAPLPTLLKAQRWILDNILETFECHPTAKAYVKGRSIKDNARLHRNQNFILKTDIEDFFSSISEFQVTTIFEQLGYRKSVAISLAKLCCLDGVLPQGAPTSGFLSNILLYDLDVELLRLCRQQELRYSRYADDITISGIEIDSGSIVKYISDLLKTKSLRINKKKTKLIGQNSRQKVTGVVVNKNLSVERGYLKSLRQECYYIEKYGIYDHCIRTGEKSPLGTLERVIGKLSHAIFIRSADRNLKNQKGKMLELRKNKFGY